MWTLMKHRKRNFTNNFEIILVKAGTSAKATDYFKFKLFI